MTTQHIQMTKPAKIVCLGHAALDRTYLIDTFPATPGKLRALGVQETGGGMAATAGVAAARLGEAVAFCGRMGDDLAGQVIRAELEREGIDTTQLRAIAGATSSTSAVLVDAMGERLLVNHRGEGLDENADWLDMRNAQQAKVVLADVRWQQGALALLTAARKAGVATVLDGDVGAGAALTGLLTVSDHAIFSASGLAELQTGDPVAALIYARSLGVMHAGVTLGAGGYLWHDRDGLHQVPAFAVAAVDTNGAGDAFHGGFVWALAQGMPTVDCVRIGQAVAAVKCIQAGTRTGLPDLATLMPFLAGQTYNRRGVCPHLFYHVAVTVAGRPHQSQAGGNEGAGHRHRHGQD